MAHDERTLISKAKVELPKAEARHAALELVKGPGAPRQFKLMLPSMLVGRDATADICVESLELSRKHLRLNRVGDEYMAVDQESRNGVFLNGVKVHSAVLRDGDQLQLADAVFIYRGTT